jgi:hypothetical protein
MVQIRRDEDATVYRLHACLPTAGIEKIAPGVHRALSGHGPTVEDVCMIGAHIGRANEQSPQAGDRVRHRRIDAAHSDRASEEPTGRDRLAQHGLGQVGRALYRCFQGITALGWREGTQFVIEERWTEGRDRRRAAEELAAKKPVVFVANGISSVAILAKVAPQVPIVQATGGDPVAMGFAANLARPGGMVTGLSNIVLKSSASVSKC